MVKGLEISNVADILAVYLLDMISKVEIFTERTPIRYRYRDAVSFVE